MAPQSNPDVTTAAADGVPVDSPSHDDLQALIPDMELLEAGAIDARTTQAAIAAAAGSGRKPVAAPKLSDQNTATTMPSFTAAFCAMLIAHAVLPIEGRAAMMIRSDGCSPLVMRSNSM